MLGGQSMNLENLIQASNDKSVYRDSNLICLWQKQVFQGAII